MTTFEIVLVLVGLFSIAGAVFDWDWFMENRKARRMSNLFGGRENGRIFYILLGTAIIILAMLGIFNIIDLS